MPNQADQNGRGRASRRVAGVFQVFSKRRGKNVWAFDVYVEGKRYRESGFSTRGEAQTAVERIRDEGLRQKYDLPPDETGLGLKDFGPPNWTPLSSPVACKAGAVGTAAEMLVCADLLTRGYDVYRSISQNGACDLLILSNGRACRVEVKTAYRRPSGKAAYTLAKYQGETFDVLALVFMRECEISYEPAPESWFARGAGVDKSV